MPDTISRIKLEFEAGRARQEVDQLTKSFTEAGRAAQGMGASMGGPTDPFARATTPVLYGPSGQVIPGGLPAGGGSQLFLIDALKESLKPLLVPPPRNPPSLPPPGGGGNILSVLRAFQGTTTSIANVDPMGAAQGGAGLLSQLKGLSPAAGAAGIAAGIVIGAGVLGYKELERMNDLGPLAQRLGGDYWGVRAGMFETGARKGLRQETLRGVAEGMAQEGMNWKQAGPLNAQNALIAERVGMDPVALGRVMGVSVRAGGKGEAEPAARILAQAFGVGRLSEAFQGVAGILEEALARGAQRGSETLKEGAEGLATRIAQLQGQGYDLQGAIRITGQVWSGARNIANVEQSFDVGVLRRFMAANPKMSLGEAQAALETDPARAAAYAVGTARIMSGGTLKGGGSRELQARLLRRSLGLTMGETYAFMGSLEAALPEGGELPELESAIKNLRMLKGGALQIAAGLEEAPARAISDILDKIFDAGNAVRSGVEAASDAIRGGVDKVGDAIQSFGEAAAEQIKALGENTEALKRFLKEPYTAPPSKDRSPNTNPRWGLPLHVPRSNP